MEDKMKCHQLCRKESFTPTSCDCGFTQKWIARDHSKNTHASNTSYKIYDALKEILKNNELGEYGKYHDPDDWSAEEPIMKDDEEEKHLMKMLLDEQHYIDLLKERW